MPTITQKKQLLPQTALTIPKIIAIGSSSGESSVIEYIVAHGFIPKGTGYITRRPLVVKLHNNTQEYGEFEHLTLNRFYNYKSIKQEIESAISKVAGVDKDISSEPINLHLYSSEYIWSHKGPNGKEPYDIEKKTKDIIKDYGMNKDSIFLNAISANVDFFTCDGLRLLMELDYKKVRTIGVLTKLDLSYIASEVLRIIKEDYLSSIWGLLEFWGELKRSLKKVNLGASTGKGMPSFTLVKNIPNILNIWEANLGQRNGIAR